MLKFNVKLKNIDKEEALIKEKARKVLMKSMFKMEELAVSFAPVDRGFLRQNIKVTPQILSDRYILTSAASYSASVEFGTRPFYAPIDPLKSWSRRNLGDEKVGYAIRAKIAREGIKAQPFMRPAFWEVKDFWLPQFWNLEFAR